MLKIRLPDHSTREYPLEDDIEIGRSSQCQIQIKNQHISRVHVRLFRRNEEWFLEDAGSSHGTFVGDRKVQGILKLAVGDVICLAPDKTEVTLTAGEGEHLGLTSIIDATGAETKFMKAADLLREVMAIPEVDQLEDYARRLRQVAEANDAFARAQSVGDLQTLLLDLLFSLFSPASATIYLEEDGCFNYASSRPKESQRPLSQTLIHEISMTCMALFVKDLNRDARFSEAASMLSMGEKSSLLASPLFEGKTVYGIVVLCSDGKGEFFENDIKLLISLAAAATLRLRNIMLNDQMAAHLRERNRDLEVMVATRTQQLEEKNEYILAGIRYAKRIQTAILPSADDLCSLLPEHFVIYKPRDVVSGDFYWCYGEEYQVFLAVVDCTGHGVPGGFLSMIGQTLLRKVIIEGELVDPGDILACLDREMRVALNQGREETKTYDGMDMALCRLALDTGELDYAGARNPLILIRQGRAMEWIRGTRRSIGGKIKKLRPFTSHSVILSPGDRVYLATDGFEDQDGAERTRFGSRSFRQLLADTADLPMATQRNALLEALAGFQGDREQRDDITIVGFQYQSDGIKT